MQQRYDKQPFIPSYCCYLFIVFGYCHALAASMIDAGQGSICPMY